MKKMICLSAAALLTLTTANAAKITSFDDRLAYSLGYQTGISLKQHASTINTNLFAAAMKAGYNGKQPALTPEQMRSTLQTFKAQMMQKIKDSMSQQASTNLKASEAFLAKNKTAAGVKVIEPGLQYKVVKMGDGPTPKATDRVSVTYKGTLSNGRVFDKSDQPVTFGLNQVIPGWTKALTHMPEGSEWVIYISPKLAYGEQAPPSIGPNQALVCDVTLVKVLKK